MYFLYEGLTRGSRDYTHGLMNIATYLIPSLTVMEGTAIAYNFLRNSPVWGYDDGKFIRKWVGSTCSTRRPCS